MRSFFYILFVFTTVFVQKGYAEDDSLIISGMNFCLREEYDKAREFYMKKIKENPSDPSGYFFSATSYHMEMLDYETNAFEKEFYALIDTTIIKAKRLIRKNPQNAIGYFYLGGAYLYKSAYQMRNGNYFSAVSSGTKGLQNMEQAVRLDSTLYDAYLGLGSYDYFRTKATGFLRWLPFIGDYRERGIQRIRLAMEKGKNSRVLAKDALVWVLMWEKRYEEAMKLAMELVSEFPNSRAFRWAPAELYMREKEWEKGEKSYREILSMIENGKKHNNYNSVWVRYQIVRACYEQKKYEDVERECKIIKKTELDKRSKTRLSSILEEIEEMKEKVSGKKAS